MSYAQDLYSIKLFILLESPVLGQRGFRLPICELGFRSIKLFFCLKVLVLARRDSDYQSDINYASDPDMTILFFRSPCLGQM
jgi:hypothetical protein